MYYLILAIGTFVLVVTMGQPGCLRRIIHATVCSWKPSLLVRTNIFDLSRRPNLAKLIPGPLYFFLFFCALWLNLSLVHSLIGSVYLSGRSRMTTCERLWHRVESIITDLQRHDIPILYLITEGSDGHVHLDAIDFILFNLTFVVEACCQIV